MSTIESPQVHRPPYAQGEVPRVSETEAIDLLIADDDTDFRGSVARRFLRRGYRVQEASDGPEALALAERLALRRGTAGHGHARDVGD